jgi:hypothetical protein
LDGRKHSHRWDYETYSDLRKPEGVPCKLDGCSIRMRWVRTYEQYSTDGGQTWSTEHAPCQGRTPLAVLKRAAQAAGVSCSQCAHKRAVQQGTFCGALQSLVFVNGSRIDPETFFCAAFRSFSSTRDTAAPIHAASPSDVSTRVGTPGYPQSGSTAVPLVVGSDPEKGAR